MRREENEKEMQNRDDITKANWELNSPATVQATLVISRESWAEDDAVELCHRATTLS